MTTPPGHPTTIAVLPFKPLRAADSDEVLELGMADTLIAKLSSSRRLIVRSLNSVRRFNRLDQDAMARLHKVRRHWRTHVAKTDEADDCHLRRRPSLSLMIPAADETRSSRRRQAQGRRRQG